MTTLSVLVILYFPSTSMLLICTSLVIMHGNFRMIENVHAVISCAFYMCVMTYSWTFHVYFMYVMTCLQVYFMRVMMYTCYWIYISLYLGAKWYLPVLTHPCSCMLRTCSGMSLVCALVKVQNLLKRGVEFLSHVAVVTGGVVLCPIVG